MVWMIVGAIGEKIQSCGHLPLTCAAKHRLCIQLFHSFDKCSCTSAAWAIGQRCCFACTLAEAWVLLSSGHPIPSAPGRQCRRQHCTWQDSADDCIFLHCRSSCVMLRTISSYAAAFDGRAGWITGRVINLRLTPGLS
jgi:hypothetical protein